MSMTASVRDNQWERFPVESSCWWHLYRLHGFVCYFNPIRIAAAISLAFMLFEINACIITFLPNRRTIWGLVDQANTGQINLLQFYKVPHKVLCGILDCSCLLQAVCYDYKYFQIVVCPLSCLNQLTVISFNLCLLFTPVTGRSPICVYCGCWLTAQLVISSCGCRSSVSQPSPRLLRIQLRCPHWTCTTALQQSSCLCHHQVCC